MNHVTNQRFCETIITSITYILVVSLPCFMPLPAHAAPITFMAEGTVSMVDFQLDNTFSLGDTFRVVYTFESTTPDSNITRPDRGDYYDPITDLSVTIGDYAATAAHGSIITVIDGISDYDRYRVDLTSMIGPSVNGYDLTYQAPIMQLLDSTGAALTSDALPTSLSDLDGFNNNGGLMLTFIEHGSESPIDQAYVRADITSITPEPGSLLLLALGGLAILRRRSR